MSGHKIVPLLEKHKDVFVHGGPVARHKQSFVDGRKKIPTDGSTELVLCAAATFKLWQPKPKAPPAAPTPTPPDVRDAAGLNNTDAPKPSPPIPRPILVWRQPHCYIKSVVPLAGKTNAFTFGFAVFYFAPNKESSAKPIEDISEFGKQLKAHADFITTQNSIDLITPPLRVREYRCSSEYEQEDWCLSYRTVLFNYWHERLESGLISAPEVFQYQTFAVDVASHPAVDSIAPHTAQKAPVVQIAISTEKAYLIPRHDQAHLEKDNLARVVSCPVAALQEVIASPTRGYRLELRFASGTVWKIACFTPEEGFQLVVELQRIWDLTRKEERFPLTNKQM